MGGEFKGVGQDTVFLMIGMLILVMTAIVVYMLIGGPYCDDMAKKTANNIKVAVDTVSKTGTFTKDSPYTTYAMLCQNKVGSPLTLNLADYKVFSTPEYMVYWEHFPEAPSNILEGMYKFDESYPFSKNMAQMIAINMGLSLFSGTLSTLSKTGAGTAVKDFSSKISKTAAGKVAKVFLSPAIVSAKAAMMPFKIINYMSRLVANGAVKSVKFLVDVTGIGKYITAKTTPNIFGRVMGAGFIKSMADNGLVESAEIATAEGGKELAVKIVRITGKDGTATEKALVPATKRAELRDTIKELSESTVEEERIMGRNLKEFFAYADDEVSLPSEAVSFKRILSASEGEGMHTGFNALVGGSMEASRKSFDEAAKTMAARYGLYAHRPITVFFDQSGITQFSKKVNAVDVFRRMKFFDDAGNPSPIINDIKKKFSDLKITTRLETEDQFVAATEKFFIKDGNAIVAGAETDTAMLAFFESEIKNGADGAGTGVAKSAYQRFMAGTASDSEISSIASKFHTNYIRELRDAGVPEDVIASAEKKLSTPQYSKRMVRDFQDEFSRAKNIRVDPADPTKLIDTDEALEISMLSASWKREPEQLALMAEDKYVSMQWEGKNTIKFVKMNIESFMVGTYAENEVKYAYLKSPNAGCESNTVCLNQKTVEQKKEDVKESEVKEYEDAYVVAKSVMVRLKRDGFTSLLGAGIGAFSFDKYPRFHLVSPCLAQIDFYNDGDDSDTGKPRIMADVNKCPTPGRSNYCYFDEGKFNEMAAGFYGALACSVIADFGKLAVFGFLLQPACSSIEMITEADTTWPFRPFQPLRNKDMNVLNCQIDKNPKDAAKLMVTACCGIAQCTADFVCSGADYAEKNRKICGQDKCTLDDLSKVAGLDYKNACGCG